MQGTKCHQLRRGKKSRMMQEPALHVWQDVRLLDMFLSFLFSRHPSSGEMSFWLTSDSCPRVTASYPRNTRGLTRKGENNQPLVRKALMARFMLLFSKLVGSNRECLVRPLIPACDVI